MTWFCWDGAHLLLHLQLQPGASRSEYAGLHGQRLKIRIRAPAVEGRANAELLAFLSDSCATGKGDISIECGAQGRVKTVRIAAPRRLPDALLQLGLVPAQ